MTVIPNKAPFYSNPDNSRHNTLRHNKTGKAAALVGAVVIGYLSHPVVDKVHASLSHVSHQQAEYKTFSRPDVSKMVKGGKIDPASVEITSIPAGSTGHPDDIARSLHATNVPLVSGEISGQLGGDTNVHIGDTIVIPKDQLELPKK